MFSRPKMGVSSVFAVAAATALAMAATDLNGSGALDVVVANSALDSVSVHLTDANGGFPAGAPVDYPVAAGNPTAVTIAIADFDGDGKRDVATANQAGGSVSVLRGLGDGTLGSPTVPPPAAVPFGQAWFHNNRLFVQLSCPSGRRSSEACFGPRASGPLSRVGLAPVA